MSAHISSVKLYVGIFLTLMVGTALTVAAAFVDMGPANNLVAMGIAIVKATLVVLFFMHVRYSSRLTSMIVASAVLFLGLLFGLTMMDYFSKSTDYVDPTLINTPAITATANGGH
jgi:cytochrome c oxidase subunit 4